jgi:hypothetical protein
VRNVALNHNSCFNFRTFANLIIYFRPTTNSEETAPDENVSEAGNTHTELSVLEKDCCKQNFQFYDKAKQGFVERFELPLVLESKLFLMVSQMASQICLDYPSINKLVIKHSCTNLPWFCLTAHIIS